MMRGKTESTEADRTERSFTNERGRNIKVAVTTKSFGRVLVEVEDPYSRSTNLLTGLEASHLRDVLVAHLGRA